jgi:hypothetical protein
VGVAVQTKQPKGQPRRVAPTKKGQQNGKGQKTGRATTEGWPDKQNNQKGNRIGLPLQETKGQEDGKSAKQNQTKRATA